MTATKHKANGKAADDLPPVNLLAERQLLGALLLEVGHWNDPAIARLQPRHFVDELHAQIFAAMKAIRGQGKLATILRVAECLKGKEQFEEMGGGVFLAKLATGVVIHEDAPDSAALIWEKWRYRRAQEFALHVQKRIDDRESPDDIDGFVAGYLDLVQPERAAATNDAPLTREQLQMRSPTLLPTVIDNFARVAEVVNIVAPTKRGKSWLVLLLALCIVMGRKWLGAFQCAAGNVLLVDNELAPNTTNYRLERVEHALGIGPKDYAGKLLIHNVRGKGMDINKLAAWLQRFKAGEFSVLILDALYKFYPPGFSENDNAHMTALYDQLTGIAERLQCVVVCIVHSTKGDQADKRVTDVGAGAGSLSRSPDNHVAIREHAEPGCVVMETAPRSFPPTDPICLRWAWPLWTRDDSIDPAELYRSRRGKEKQTETVWTAELFASSFVRPEPRPIALIVAEACEAGLSSRRANELVKQADALGKLHRWLQEDGRALVYATVPQPADLRPATPAQKAPRKGRK